MIQNYKNIIENSINGIPVNKFDSESIFKFIDFLLSKNNELNLVSRKLTLNEIINDHIIDCLAGFTYFKPYSTITDLGSGGGFPGIILALIFHEKKIILVEKSPKKFQFLNETKKLLKINNVELHNGLVEELKINSEVVTCRAFKDIKTIIDMTKKFYDNKGIYILYKAKMEKIEDELNITKQKYNLNYTINKLDMIKEKERHIVVISKKNN
jgi:16S rRNA (guanine527-N7)-methyltransferase